LPPNGGNLFGTIHMDILSNALFEDDSANRLFSTISTSFCPEEEEPELPLRQPPHPTELQSPRPRARRLGFNSGLGWGVV